MYKKYAEPALVLALWALFTWVCLQAALDFPVTESCETSEHTGLKHCSTYYSVFAPVVAVGSFLEDYDGAVVGLFTIVLAISTILLWQATHRLAAGSDESLRMMMSKERAYLTPAFPTCNFPRIGPLTTIEEIRDLVPTATHQWANIGGSAARIHKMRLEIVIAPQLPKRPDWSQSGASVHYGHYVIGKDYFEDGFRRTWDAPIGEVAAAALIAEQATFFVLGGITYTDVFDKRRSYVFAMKWKPTEGNLVSTIGAGYNRLYEGDYPEDYPEG